MTGLVLALLLLAPQTPSPSPSPSPSPAEKAEKPEKPEKVPEKEEPPIVTRHETRIGGRLVKYTVTTGMMPLKSEAGATEARIFFMAYTADRAAAPPQRPLTFSVHGGAGVFSGLVAPRG